VNNWKVIFAAVVIFGSGVVTGGLLVNYVQRCTNKPIDKLAITSTEVRVINSVTNTNSPVVRAPAPPRVAASGAEPGKPGQTKLPEMLSKQFSERLNEELHLTQKQRESVQKIISEGQNQMRKTLQDTRLEIREVLTADQRKDFDELMKRSFHKPIFGTNGAPSGSSTNLLAGSACTNIVAAATATNSPVQTNKP
jgi:hypothetical protein